MIILQILSLHLNILKILPQFLEQILNIIYVNIQNKNLNLNIYLPLQNLQLLILSVDLLPTVSKHTLKPIDIPLRINLLIDIDNINNQNINNFKINKIHILLKNLQINNLLLILLILIIKQLLIKYLSLFLVQFVILIL